MSKLMTIWGDKLDPHHVLQEYPRPQLMRSNYQSLNGYWEYAITRKDVETPPSTYDGSILVPFSPEAILSGVSRNLTPHDTLWYHKSFTPPTPTSSADRLLLHFQAIDRVCVIYMNGKKAATNTFGYLPITVDATPYLEKSATARQDENSSAHHDENATARHDENGAGHHDKNTAARHEGSFAPIDIVIAVNDESDEGTHAHGKQSLTPKGMFYTAQSGIWQSVWAEWVPETYVDTLQITPNLDKSSVSLSLNVKKTESVDFAHGEESSDVSTNSVKTQADKSVTLTFTLCSPTTHYDDDLASNLLAYSSSDMHVGTAFSMDKKYGDISVISIETDHVTSSYSGSSLLKKQMELSIPKEFVHAWTPETPYLYPLLCQVGSDRFLSYMALRSFTLEKDSEGYQRAMLNHAPYYLQGVLDQGYWPDGLMTAPSDEALLFDIEGMKQLGFHMIRKHIKIENERFYYHCDRLGMVVLQDMVSGGKYRYFAQTALPNLFTSIANNVVNDANMGWLASYILGRPKHAHKVQEEWLSEMQDTVRFLYSHPCICGWGIFNEGWGQFETRRAYALLEQIDQTRLVDANSGWFDQKIGSFVSEHNYFRAMKVRTSPTHERGYFLSEYGGIACTIADHTAARKVYGYGVLDQPEEFSRAFYELRDQKVRPLVKDGLSGSVYTQVSDIEDEVNGIFTYDRKVLKLKGKG